MAEQDIFEQAQYSPNEMQAMMNPEMDTRQNSFSYEEAINNEETRKKKREQDILKEARDRLKIAEELDKENRDSALADLKFTYVEGAQWPEEIKARRKKRPCIESNKLPTYVDQVVGDQRQNRPSIKVMPESINSKPRTAKILSGWIKHVLQISKADVVIDHGFEHAVGCGYGAMRVITKYISDDSFEQEAFVEKVDNALAVFWGKHSKYDCSDARYCFVINDMDRKEFEEAYGEKPTPFSQADGQGIENWSTASTYRIAEYFRKEPIKKMKYLLDDGRTVDTLAEGDFPIKARQVESYKIEWFLLSANKIHDEKVWVGKKYIPIIPIWGKEINIGGKNYVRGLIKYAKGPQAMNNYWKSADTERIALAHKAPVIMTATQLGSHKAMWDNANDEPYAYLLIDADPRMPGFPKREAPPEISSAMAEKTRETDQDIRDTIGLQKSSMGIATPNRSSGVLERERKREGDVGTFAFIDNAARSIKYLGDVLLDVAPGILDTERIIRMVTEDESSEFEVINVETESGEIMNDISQGSYGIAVTTGPSFTTQRSEARESMQAFMQNDPGASELIGDLYARKQDWPGADEVAERLEFRLPPEIKAKLEKKRAESEGEPPEPPPQAQLPPPDPLMEAKIQEAGIKLEELQIKVQQEKERLKGLELENELKISTSKETVKKMVDEIHQENQTAKTQ